MNKKDVSRQSILDASKSIAGESGMASINMRSVAALCGVSIGTVYNYYPSKADLIIATIGSVWSEIMKEFNRTPASGRFTDSVAALQQCVIAGQNRYPDFFETHGSVLSDGDKNQGRQAMDRFFGRIREILLTNLNHDSFVRNENFSDRFTREELIDFILSNLISPAKGPVLKKDILPEVIRRLIY